MTAPSFPPAFEECLWPDEERDDLIVHLAGAAGVTRVAAPESIGIAYADLVPGFGSRLQAAMPFFVRIEADGERRGGLVAVASRRGDRAVVVRRGGGRSIVAISDLAEWWRGPAERRAIPGLDSLLERAAIVAERAPTVRRAMIEAALGGHPVVAGWCLRCRATSLGEAFRKQGWWPKLVFAALALVLQLVLFVLLWSLIGERALSEGADGRGPGPWLGALAAFLALRLGTSWLTGRMAVEAGQTFREGLLQGLLGLDVEPLRAEGVGQLLGRVMEVGAIESLALGAGLQTVSAAFELATGAVILAMGAAPFEHLVLLGVALAVAFVLGRSVWRRMNEWSERRIELTHDLIESMVGHRTIVVQQPPDISRAVDERALSEYEKFSETLDRASAAFSTLLPRGWLVAAVAALLPLLRNGGPRSGGVAVSLGGVLFVYSALRRLTQAFPTVQIAQLAWRRAAVLFGSAGSDEPAGRPPASHADRAPPAEPGALITAKSASYCYPGRLDPVLSNCSIEIRRGQKVLIEGASGCGKSTLGALLAGMIQPQAGVLALEGIPQEELGLLRWRRRIGIVPQFHENHIFAAPIAFNLLMGRNWPPRVEDLADAEAICRGLDLAGLIARMPSGLEQPIGETGWQLSHGERSRVFMARSLLQRLDARVFDETFASLDPETLERILPCILQRAETLIVISHP